MFEAEAIREIFENALAVRLEEHLEDSDLSRISAAIEEIVESNLAIKRFERNTAKLVDATHYLYSKASTHIILDPARLEYWAGQISRFALLNSRNENFKEVFTKFAYNDAAIINLMDCSTDSQTLLHYIKQQLASAIRHFHERVDTLSTNLQEQTKDKAASKEYIATTRQSIDEFSAFASAAEALAKELPNKLPPLPPEFKTDLLEAAQAAVEPAIADLADYIIGIKDKKDKNNKKIEQIFRTSSWISRRGVIPFTMAAEGLEISPDIDASTNGVPAAATRKVVERCVTRIEAAHLVERIHNSSPILADLVGDIVKVIKSNKTGTEDICALAISIQEINGFLQIPSDPGEDWQPPQDIKFYIGALVSATSLYIQSFAIFNDISKQMDMAAKTIGEIGAPENLAAWKMLTSLAREPGIFTPRTHEVVRATSGAVSNKEKPASPTAKTIAIGVLRGSLRSLGKSLVEAALDGLWDPLKEITKNVSTSLYEQKILPAAIALFQKNRDLLYRLAEQMPNWFAWIKIFLDAMK